MIRAVIAALVVLSPLLSQAQVSSDESASHLRSFLENFRRDPKTTMNTIPTKYDAHGNVVKDAPLFSEDQIRGNNFISAKDKVRSKITFNPSQLVMAQIDGANEPQSIFLTSKSMNIADLGKPGLQNGAVKTQPWSSDYWATFRAGLAFRYADDNYTHSSWSEYKPVFTQLLGVNFQDPEDLDNRSPAEKYDLLMGDKNFTLTKWWIQNAVRAENTNGDVETWQGICHGWSPASFMMPRPSKAIDVKLADGNTLRFFPDDLKALADALYANNRVSQAFVGQRCNDKDPQQDENGRIISSACWDINPGSFHTIMLNRVGIDKQSLVMDATYDYEVWNQPIVKYSFTYFNPQSGDTAATLKDATISKKDYTSDNFAKYRSPDAVSIVGVQMSVTYTVETYSQHAMTNSSDDDALRSADYVYDLELDKNGNIIGGEWYQNAHPDFMWSPSLTAKPTALQEPALYIAWNPLTGLPTDQAKGLAAEASGQGQVLNGIIQRLFQLSSQQ